MIFGCVWTNPSGSWRNSSAPRCWIGIPQSIVHGPQVLPITHLASQQAKMDHDHKIMVKWWSPTGHRFSSCWFNLTASHFTNRVLIMWVNRWNVGPTESHLFPPYVIILYCSHLDCGTWYPHFQQLNPQFHVSVSWSESCFSRPNPKSWSTHQLPYLSPFLPICPKVHPFSSCFPSVFLMFFHFPSTFPSPFFGSCSLQVGTELRRQAHRRGVAMVPDSVNKHGTSGRPAWGFTERTLRI